MPRYGAAEERAAGQGHGSSPEGLARRPEAMERLGRAVGRPPATGCQGCCPLAARVGNADLSSRLSPGGPFLPGSSCQGGRTVGTLPDGLGAQFLSLEGPVPQWRAAHAWVPLPRSEDQWTGFAGTSSPRPDPIAWAPLMRRSRDPPGWRCLALLCGR